VAPREGDGRKAPEPQKVAGGPHPKARRLAKKPAGGQTQERFVASSAWAGAGSKKSLENSCALAVHESAFKGSGRKGGMKRATLEPSQRGK
jgi:hypothetical protein